jgi:ABC-2 type transport system permease protein
VTERYAGAALLLRHGLRRDRWLVVVWSALLLAVVAASAVSTRGLYPTEQDRVAAARAINADPALVALYGPILDVRSAGELAMTKVTVVYALLLALLLVVVVGRRLRTEEESGRAELVGGTAVGRDAPLAAALVEGALVGVLVGALAAAAAVAGGLPAVGAAGLGLTWAGTALVATALAAVASQVAASARTCTAVAVAALLALDVVRAAGDLGPGWLGWLSPLGWNTRFSAWSDPRWWVLLLHVGLALVLAAGAQVLRARRDLGAGLVQARPGPAHGSPRLGSALALTWRQQRPALVGWTVGVLALGTTVGAVAPGAVDLVDSAAGRAAVRSLGGAGSLVDSLLAAVLSIAAVLVTCAGLAVVSRAGAEERDGRAALVLSTGTSRTGLLLGQLLVALGAAAWLLALTGLGLGLGLGRDVVPLVGAGLAQLPAVGLVIGLATLLHAVRSGWAPAGWLLLGAFFVLGQVGSLLRLPDRVVGLSPYEHLAAMPAEPFAVGPAAVLVGLALGCVGVATWRWGRRDVG